MYESHSEMKISCHETHLSSGLFWESECERIVHRTMRKVKSEGRKEGRKARSAKRQKAENPVETCEQRGGEGKDVCPHTSSSRYTDQ